jgi:hypothetical protein
MSLVASHEIYNDFFAHFLTQVFPDEIIRYIIKFFSPAVHFLIQTSKQIKERLSELADEYVLKRRVTTLLPLNATNITTMMISLTPSLIKLWGLSQSNEIKEMLLCEAVRTGDSRGILNIISHGVDLDIRRLSNHKIPEQRGAYFPIEEAVSFNRPEQLKLLIDQGADLNPMCNVVKRWFMDGYTDLLDSTSDLKFCTNVPSEIPDIILEAYIKKGDLTPFICRNWRSDIRTFDWFCRSIPKIKYGTRTNVDGWCFDKDCDNRCENLFMCNGVGLCETCYKNGKHKEPLTPENIRERLWHGTFHDMIDDDDTIDYDDMSSIASMDFDSQIFYDDPDIDDEVSWVDSDSDTDNFIY